MVFESVIVDILNKFLGDYVENLDSSQLKIGIWSGDVSLKNLSLKPSALDELELPVKTVYGHLGKLLLKIPWKNIYTSPVEVTVENLFLLVNPIQDVVFNAEKEEKLKQEVKQALINKVELAKKKEKEKDMVKVDDTFVEKLAAQIVKNVQVSVQNIHLRYEDRVAKPEQPFSIGIILHKLALHTTNESCDRYVLPQETSHIFYKKMVIEGLSVYWNANAIQFTNFEVDEESTKKDFLVGITCRSRTARDYTQILGPINSEVKMQINSKPEIMNFTTPKIFLALVLDQLVIRVTRSQYQDLISLAAAFDRMSKGTRYRKYRPSLINYKGHYKEWWSFAIRSVLEDVRTRYRNCTWEEISKHLKLCKTYQQAYRAKLEQKLTSQVTNDLIRLELLLDAFNIILLRQKVENEVEREGNFVIEQKRSRKSWFSGWFSSKSDNGHSADEAKADLAKKFENVMTVEEKKKLFKAIDYHETASPTLYPTTFVAIRMEYTLRLLRIDIEDDYQKQNEECPLSSSVLCVEFRNFLVTLQQRPAAKSFSLSLSVESFQTWGLSQKNILPSLIKSKQSSNGSEIMNFLSVFFETNPEDENYDQRLYVTLKPLKVVYDAITVIRILEVFTPETDISSVKDQLQIAASTKLKEMKEKSAMGLQYAIEKSIKLDLKIDLMAPYLIIPFGGYYTKNELSLVLNLGRINIQSKSRGTVHNIKKLFTEGYSKDDVLDQILSQCYDHFFVCLGNVQVLMLNAGQSWKPTSATTSNLFNGYILHPTSICIDIYRCLLDNDPRLPKIKICGNLPDVTIQVTAKKLIDVTRLMMSLPLPQKTVFIEEGIGFEIKEGTSLYDSASSLREKLESLNKLQFPKLRKNFQANDQPDDKINGFDKTFVDVTNVEVSFNWKALNLCIQYENVHLSLIEASVSGLQLKLTQKASSMEVDAKLENISLTQNYQNSVVPTITTSLKKDGVEQYLFACSLLMVDKNSPMFGKIYNRIGTSMEVDLSKLCMVAHQEAILGSLEWFNNVQNSIINLIESYQEEKNQQNEISLNFGTGKRRKSSLSSNMSIWDSHKKLAKPKSALGVILENHMSAQSTNECKEMKMVESETTELKLSVRLNVIQICLQTSSRLLATMDVDGLNASIVVKKSNTIFKVILQSVSVGDLNPETIYNKIAYMHEGKNVLKLDAMVYNNNEFNGNNFDLLINLQMNCLQCVFVDEFIGDILDFMNNFQTSKEVILTASAIAVASAKKNVREVYQSSTKISLDIFADAPIVIVPQNNRSAEVFVIDFGNLSVRNVLEKVSISDSKCDVIIDRISINLQDVKIVRTNYERTNTEHVLLQPVTSTVTVKRNLSASWYTDIPVFDIDGCFYPIHVMIRGEDYQFLLDTLTQNIRSESQKESTPTATKINTTSKSTVELNLLTKGSNIECEVSVDRSILPETKTTVKFTMAVEGVTIDLFSRKTEQNQNEGLAKFTLSLLRASVYVLTNDDIIVNAFFSDCCLDDIRPGKAANPVKRYMQRKTENDVIVNSFANRRTHSLVDNYGSVLSEASTSYAPEDIKSSMIDLNIQRNSKKIRVSARVFSFILILNLDHILKIQEFFTRQSDADSVLEVSTISKKKNNLFLQQGVSPNIDCSDSTPSITTFCIIIEKPDIILVENLDDINTNALILNNEANISIQFNNDNHTAINGALRNLQLYSCCYNPSKRSQTMALILHPITVDLVGSTLNEGKFHLDLKVSDIKVSITGRTIELLAKIASTLSLNIEAEIKQDDVISEDYSNVWQQNVIGDNYWFLKPVEEGVDIVYVQPNDMVLQEVYESGGHPLIIMISAPSIEVVLEAGTGKKTLPLLAVSSSFQGTLLNRQNSLTLESHVSLEMGYYNSRLALWEPVIEPLSKPLIHSFSKSRFIPWQMKLTLQLNKHVSEGACSQNEVNFERNCILDTKRSSILGHQCRLPEMALFVKSEERIEITVTKTCLDVLNTLIKSFNQAANLKSKSNLSILTDDYFSSYVFINDLGIDVLLYLNFDHVFKVLRTDRNETIYIDDSTDYLTLKPTETVNVLIKKQDNKEEKLCNNIVHCFLEKLNMTTDWGMNSIKVNIPARGRDIFLPVSKSDKRYFALRVQKDRANCVSPECWGLISEVDIANGNVVTTLRSVVRIFNHFTVQIYVFYLKSGKNKNELVEAGKISPSHYLNLPVHAVHTSSGMLYFAPSRYSVSNEPFVWKNLQNNVTLSLLVHCISNSAENHDPFFIRVLGDTEQIYYENTASFTIASSAYNIHLRPTLIFKNFLPVDVVCCVQGVLTESVLKPGERLNVCTAEPDQSTIIIRLNDYMNKVWTCKKVIKDNAPVFSVWTFIAYDDHKERSMTLGVWRSIREDSLMFSLYCPYWIINKTTMNLSYKGVDDDGTIFEHPKDLNKPILFSFKEKLFFSKKKLCVRANSGEWSDKLSIDAAGSSGSVSCKYNNRIYQLGIYIKLSYNSLTKQIIFSPFFTICNICSFAIEFRENKVENATWIEIYPHACLPFWPTAYDDPDRMLELKIRGTDDVTPSFSYLIVKTYSLMLLNKYGGLVADVQICEGGVQIEISSFEPKLAPALIINDTESSVEFVEVDLCIKSLDNVKESENAAVRCLQNQNVRSWQLRANKEVLFSWSLVNSMKPVLLINKRPSPVDLRKDGIGEFSATEDPDKKYWISFLNGMQRVLLLTANEYVLKGIEAVGDLDNIKREFVLSMEGVGLSLVNNITKNELLYLSITSSGVTWEVQKKSGKRFKAVHENLNWKLEKAYINYSNLIKTDVNEIFANVQIDMEEKPCFVVNFAFGTVISPLTGNIRRIYNSGLWTEIRSSERYNQIHSKVNRLQIDNQKYNALFPVIFFPIRPPKSIASNEDTYGVGEKPFAELSIVQKINERSALRQFKYFKMLIQEFHVKVDFGFINGLVKLFEADKISDEEELNQFKNDEKVYSQPLCQLITTVPKQDFYDLLHFSPLKIHVSFSLAGENTSDETSQQGVPVVNFLTQSVGVTLTDVNDVVFRLAYFERKHKFYSLSQIRGQVESHYTSQFVKNLYVLILGLDVLGNPFGLVTGLKQGVEDFFYEPFQGAIQGPSEFAEGVLLGVRSLFGHTVGGAAGAVGRITGAMGKGIAALTLDEEYQQKRRQRLTLQQQSITEGGRGLVMGVVEGVGGVISKPIWGAREEGVEGFVKGIGKGVVGLFMRPASGVVDFASGTVDVVRRVATCSEETRRCRLPRIIAKNGLVVPFSKRDARGYKYLLDIEKGRFVKTDSYLYHVTMGRGSHPEKEILLITNNRIIYIVKSNDVFSDNIKVEWQYTWNEIEKDDGINETEDGICIRNNIVQMPSRSIFNSIFKKSNKGKILLIHDADVKQELLVVLKEVARESRRSL